jgi:hypothetical protein
MTFHVSWLENQNPAHIMSQIIYSIWETQLTLLHGDGSNIAHVVLLLDQLRRLNLPNLLDILVGETTEELNEVGKELTLVRVIKKTIILTAVCLVRIINGPGLVSNVGDWAHVALALVKHLRRKKLDEIFDHSEYLDR